MKVYSPTSLAQASYTRSKAQKAQSHCYYCDYMLSLRQYTRKGINRGGKQKGPRDLMLSDI